MERHVTLALRRCRCQLTCVDILLLVELSCQLVCALLTCSEEERAPACAAHWPGASRVPVAGGCPEGQSWRRLGAPGECVYAPTMMLMPLCSHMQSTDRLLQT